MTGKWVDFKEIKQKITMEMVLSHYGLLDKLKKSKKGLRGACPIHKGSHANQFHVDTVKNKWNCFGGCDMKQLEGHVIGFVAAMEGVDIREAALKLAEWFELDGGRPPDKRSPADSENQKSADENAEEETANAPDPNETSEEPENQALSFKLKTLTADHPFLRKRGVTPDAVSHFQAGYCSRGMFKGRIVFPLHRPLDGKLIGYIGRTVEEVTDENPKWLLPSVVKPKLLFNYHRIDDRDCIILVEGCFGAIAVFQAGFSNVAALLGRSILEDDNLSYDQLRLITRFNRAVLLLDGDKDGREAAQKGLEQLAGRIFVRVVSLPQDQDPDDLSPAELQEHLSFLR